MIASLVRSVFGLDSGTLGWLDRLRWLCTRYLKDRITDQACWQARLQAGGEAGRPVTFPEAAHRVLYHEAEQVSRLLLEHFSVQKTKRVRWPGAGPAGATCDRLVSLLDLGPPLIEMTGCGTLSQAQGRSWVPLLRGQEPENWRDDVHAEFHGQRFFWTQLIVWTDRIKYVFNGFDFDELYDLENDPYELVNLAPDPAYAGVLREMAARMWAHARAVGDDNLCESNYGMFLFAPTGPII